MAGLAVRHRGLAVEMAVCLFSLAGIPPLAGFVGKFELFASAWGASRVEDDAWMFQSLAILGAINSAIGAYYYLRIVVVMFLRPNPGKPPRRPPDLAPGHRHHGLHAADVARRDRLGPRHRSLARGGCRGLGDARPGAGGPARHGGRRTIGRSPSPGVGTRRHSGVRPSRMGRRPRPPAWIRRTREPRFAIITECSVEIRS